MNICKKIISYFVCFYIISFLVPTIYADTLSSGSANIQYDYPNSAPNSYQYAKTRLFDNVDLWLQNGGTSGGGNTPTGCTPDQMKDPVATAKSFGFIVQGPGASIPDKLSQTVDTLCILDSYPLFMSLLHLPQQTVSVTLSSLLQCTDLSTADTNGVIINLWCEKDRNRLILSHELGHVISFRNRSTLFADWETNVYKGGANPLPTWNCLDHGSGQGAPHEDECFADMVGQYLVYPTFREVVGNSPVIDHLGNAFPEYPTQWPLYFNFVKDKIYGPANSSGGNGKGHPATDDPCPNSSFHTSYLRDFQLNTVFSPKNFGDPVCDYTQDKLSKLIMSADSAHFYCWYMVVVPGESSYDPNNEQVIDPYDPAHAWGNFQMGRGKNGIDDHGDVDWQTQWENAHAHNVAHNNSFDYWSTAMRDPKDCHP